MLVFLVLIIIVYFAWNQVTEEQPPAGNEEQVVEEEQPPPVLVIKEIHDIDMRVYSGGYQPELIQVNKGDTVNIHIHATDGLVHGFSLPVYKISERVEPGEVVDIEFVASIPGRFEFYSNVASSPNEGNVRGTLEVAGG